MRARCLSKVRLEIADHVPLVIHLDRRGFVEREEANASFGGPLQAGTNLLGRLALPYPVACPEAELAAEVFAGLFEVRERPVDEDIGELLIGDRGPCGLDDFIGPGEGSDPRPTWFVRQGGP